MIGTNMRPTVTLLTALACWLDLTAIALCQPPSGRWTLVPELSDELAGSSLDLTKWDTKWGYPKSRAFAFK